MASFRPVWIFLCVALTAAGGLGFRFLTGHSEAPLPTELLRDIAPEPQDPSKLIVVGEKGLYLKHPQGWERLFTLPEHSTGFQKLLVHPKLRGTVFLLAPEGILKVEFPHGKTRWIFRETSPSRNRVYSLALHPDDPARIFLATERGLFHSRDGGLVWEGPLRWPENQLLEFVGFLPGAPPTLVFATNRELFFSRDEGRSFESGLSLPFRSPEDPQAEASEEGPSFSLPRFTCLAASDGIRPRLWIGTRQGVYESGDRGVSWEKVPEEGLETAEVLDLVFSESLETLIAATPRGVFQFRPREKHWEKLPLPLVEPGTALALRPFPERKGDLLFITSGHEVFEWVLEVPEVEAGRVPGELFRKLLDLEPTVLDMQKKAIRYGELGNGKIRRWHWGSRVRAFVPRLTFGKNFSLSENVDIDRGGTNDPDRFIRGPSESDQSWDVNLTWELGDFLYSTAQTSIDSRAKLLVELRESLLSQVTRLYFERRRTQWELASLPPEAGFQERLDLVLRLDELTAQLDALTNGFLSEQLEATYQNHPELNRLFSLLAGPPDGDSQEKQET